MKNVRQQPDNYMDQMILNNAYYDHARINTLKRASRTASIDDSLTDEPLPQYKQCNQPVDTMPAKQMGRRWSTRRGSRRYMVIKISIDY